jgi:hypothetical protein
MRLFGKDKHNCDDPWNVASPRDIEIREMLLRIIINQEKIMAAIDDLAAAVAAEDTVIDSAVALINGIPALIAAAGVDQAKLNALQTDITNKAATLSAAVLANTPTPAASAPPVTPAAANTAATAAVAAS